MEKLLLAPEHLERARPEQEIDMTTLAQASEQNRFYQYALWLAFFTIFYNALEELVSVYLGAQDEALTLFGFGIDSFIEVISAVGTQPHLPTDWFWRRG